MWLRGGSFRFLGWLVMVLLASPPGYFAANKVDVQKEIAEALDAIRGKDLSKLTDTEMEAFNKQLDEAWETALKHPKEAKRAVRAALSQESQDSFRTIDLARLLLALDSDLTGEAAAALAKADPNAYPDGFFQVASGMAALHCESCLPVALKMLELRELRTGIAAHALPVGMELGLIFTIGQYGDASLGGVLSGLDSESCVIRGNATLATGQLLPAAEPAQVGKIALGDPCEGSRRNAWGALGMLNSPSLSTLAMKRLAAEKPPSVDERKAMVSGLSLAFSRDVFEPLRLLSSDSDPEVAKAAREGLEGVEKHAPTLAELSKQVGSAPASFRAQVQRLLKKARQDGRFEFRGRRMELLPALSPADLPLLNEARAAVLNRVSDECLYEYFDLTYVASALRTVSASGKAPGGIDAEGETTKGGR
jgi:hypothetical protein